MGARFGFVLDRQANNHNFSPTIPLPRASESDSCPLKIQTFAEFNLR